METVRVARGKGRLQDSQEGKKESVGNWSDREESARMGSGKWHEQVERKRE